MAGERGTVNPNTANEVLSESLGLDMDDLGANSLDTFENDLANGDDGDDGDDSDQDINVGPNAGDNDQDINAPDDGLSVTHTRQNQQQQRPNNQQQQQPRQKQWNPAQHQLTRDKKGNLLGPDGKVVAYAGREARLYQSHQQLRGEYQRVQGESQRVSRDLTTRLNKAIEIGTQAVQRYQELSQQPNIVKEYGLSDEQTREALSLAKQSITDPVGAVKMLLTRAAARGIDLTTLGLQPGGFDTKSLMDVVREEIAKATKPVGELNARQTQEQQQRQQSEQAANAVKEELSNFLADNPAAKNWLHVFNNVYASDDPQYNKMPLGEVWARIQLNLMKQGIDPENPPARGQRSSQQNRQGNNNPNPRLPNGRGNPSGGSFNGQRQSPQNNELAPVDMSYDDILKEVLKNAG